MLPLLKKIGTGFVSWDAVVSWNRWALELYNNTYDPIDAAYPILLPSMWALIYKIQGTSDIWWSGQIILFVFPVMTLAILLSLYYENKNRSFILMAILIYPYLISGLAINGYMDMPVMIIGTLSLIILYAAEIYKDKPEFDYYIYASLLLAGIASITKQAGLAFIVFDLIYIGLNIKLFKHKKRLILVILLSFLYFLTYLSLYYLNSMDTVTGNFAYLEKISKQRELKYNNFNQYLYYLYSDFFSYPATIPLLAPLVALFKLKIITPGLILSHVASAIIPSEISWDNPLIVERAITSRLKRDSSIPSRP